MDDIMVSICCMTYNHEKFIEKALKGFLMQKADFKYEILVHDDASTDKTQEILKKYEKKYPELIKVIYQKENQYSLGKSPVKNLYNIASGKYIAICEGDDYWIDEYKLQKQVDFLEENIDFYATYHNVLVVDENNKINEKEQKCFSLYEEQSFEKKEVKTLSLVSQTGSIVARNFWKELNKKEKEIFIATKCNGDIKLGMLFNYKGKIKHFKEIMSCYRRIYTGDSWNARNKNKNMFFYYFITCIELKKMIDSLFGEKLNIIDALNSILMVSFIEALKRPNKENFQVFYKIYKRNEINIINFIISIIVVKEAN